MDSSVSTTRHGVSAIVEHEYTAKESDELNLIKGAIIQNIKIQTGGWWEGTLASGKIGMFPDNFVRVLEPDDKNPVVLREKSATVNRRCKAVYSYTQNNNDELTLAVGDIIEFLGEVEEGWWRGKLGARIGVFPSNFVAIVENVSPMLANRRSISGNNNNSNNNNNISSNSINNSNSSLRNRNRSLSNSREDLLLSNSSLEKDAPSLPPKPIREQCKVLFAYSAANEDELELKEGDLITIITKELPDKGWWKGEIKGRIGVFPDNFVVAIPFADVSPAKEIHNHHHHKPERPPQSLIPASKSSLLNHTTVKTNTNRKDIFGSKDSLNDTTATTTAATKTTTSNVAQYRKSLDNKLLDNNATTEKHSSLTKQQKTSAYSDLRKSLDNLDDKKSSGTTSTSSPPPPVLTKKPTIPIKKSPTVGSVASNLFSGFKQKNAVTKPGGGDNNNNNKSMSHDSFDGIGSSKLSDNNIDKIHDPHNHNHHHHNHQLGKDDSIEFDNVERNSILQDMRAGRAKAPKRRPPTTTANSLGESNNVAYVNGTSDSSVNSNGSGGIGGGGGNDSFTKSLDSNNDEDGSQLQQQVKPKPRGWEKQKAPWMAELKASQAKKVTPMDSKSTLPTTTSSSSSSSTSLEQHKSLEHHHHHHHEQNSHNEKYDMSKSFSTSHVISVTSASASAFTSTSSTVTSSSSIITSSSSSTSTAATTVNHKKIHDNSNFEIRNHNIIDGKNIIQTEQTGLSSSKRPTDDNVMIKSMSSISGTKIRISDNGDDKQQRPNSVNVRHNRSISPLNSGLSVTANSNTIPNTTTTATTTTTTNNTTGQQRLTGKTIALSSTSSSSSSATTTISSSASSMVANLSSSSNTTIPPMLNSTTISLHNSSIPNHFKIGGDIPKCNNANPIVPIHLENVCPRVLELEQRVFNLERFVHIQNLTITDLLQSIKEESERVQQLKGELEKYAQCVTQV